ncbi:MAG TPA: pyruvate kinase [Acidimicrobiales bacterium]|nr:pyruvate kinase [Acidimicrobiales bacterium]
MGRKVGRRTKIVATIGPASSSPAALRELIDAGMDVARVGLAHGTPEEHAAVIRRIREAAVERSVAVLADLPGPKVRTGAFPEEGAELGEGETVKVVAGDGPSTAAQLQVDFPGAFDALTEGCTVGLGDGTIVLRVEDCGSGGATALVVRGGVARGRPGLQLPSQNLAVSVPTDADLRLLDGCLGEGVDMVAMSFVRNAEEVCAVVDAAGSDPPMVLAKVETAEAVEELDAILSVADGVMVARGDLGIRLPLEDVPHVQKHIIRTSIAAGRPVITATQMLESMVTSATPTRAEVSDVANAVFDGTDAVMLSAETAIGVDPPGVVRTMARVVERAEQEAHYTQWGAKLGKLQRQSQVSTPMRITDAVSHAAWQAAATVEAAAIVCCSRTGGSARAIARFRPVAPVITVSPTSRTVRQLSLTWGVESFLGTPHDTTDEIVWYAIETLVKQGVLAGGDVVVILAGDPDDPDPATDVLRVVRVR